MTFSQKNAIVFNVFNIYILNILLISIFNNFSLLNHDKIIIDY